VAKTPKTATITVGSKEYKLQHPGVRWYLENSDACRGPNGVIQTAKYAQNILDHVVTDPSGLKIDDIETVAEIEELVQKADSFLRS